MGKSSPIRGRANGINYQIVFEDLDRNGNEVMLVISELNSVLANVLRERRVPGCRRRV
jgi:hypothetical protein